MCAATLYATFTASTVVKHPSNLTIRCRRRRRSRRRHHWNRRRRRRLLRFCNLLLLLMFDGKRVDHRTGKEKHIVPRDRPNVCLSRLRGLPRGLTNPD